MDGLLNVRAKDVALFKSSEGYWLFYFPERWDIGKAVELSEKRIAVKCDLSLVEFVRIIPCTETVRIPKDEIVYSTNL